jgi:mannose-6-phosphate isomerase-like protein (cupin superfamily)
MSAINKISIKGKLSQIKDIWKPAIAGELNGQHVKLAKIHGEFVFHKHDEEDEFFMVIKGNMRMDLEDRSIDVNEGEFIIIPKGTLHRPYSEEETHLLLFEPASTINTGNVRNEMTLDELDKV